MLDEPSILLADAAKIADLEYGTLRSWIQRGAVSLEGGDQLPVGRGGRTMVTLRSVLGFAIMRELTKVGFPPHAAGGAASNTMHFPQPYDSPQKWLQAGELYPDGKTYLLVFVPVKEEAPNSENDYSVHCWRVRIIEPKDYANLFDDGIMDPVPATRIVINLTALFDRVHRNLAELRESRRAGEVRPR